jgi:hypothetical protein
MSYAWTFHGYAEAEFNQVFGRTESDEVESFLEWVQSELGADPAIESLVRRSLTDSLSYERLSDSEMRLLDSIVVIAFSPEGFDSQLKLHHLSPDGLHPTLIDELLKRHPAEGVLLPFLRTGRRYGEKVPSDCGYCLLDLDQVEQLLAEVQRSVDTPGEWPHDYMPLVIEECLTVPLRKALKAREFVYGHLG